MASPRSRSGVLPAQEAFTYTPLNSANHEIRLIRVHSSDEGNSEIRCSLRTVSLKDRPIYEALSYRWGNATTMESIELNGKRLQVTVNLADALRRLSTGWTSTLAAGNAFNKATGGSDEAGKLDGLDESVDSVSKQITLDQRRAPEIWIDAIAINQTDWEERKAQVQIMHQIYKQAEFVRIWLGEVGSEQASLSFDVLRVQLSNNGKPEREQFDRLGGTLSDAEQKWTILDELFQNEYWSRAWVVQEIAFAQSTVVCYGALSMTVQSWSNLQNNLLHSFPAHYGPDPRKYDGCQSQIRASDMREQNAKTRKRIWAAISRIAGGSAFQRTGVAELCRLLPLLQGAAASLEIDCLYAMLSFINVEGLQFPPDYSATPTEAFCDFSFEFMNATQSFRLLLQSREPSSPLPSWALDFRVQATPDIGYPERYDASANTQFRISRPSQGVLKVPGLVICTVGDVGSETVARIDPYLKWRYISQLHRMLSNPGETFQNPLDRVLFLQLLDGVPPREWKEHVEKYLANVIPPINLQPEAEFYSERSEFLAIETTEHDGGVASVGVREGDEICILASHSIPLCVRRIESGQNRFRIVGSAIVDGIMHGQAVKSRVTELQCDPNDVFEDLYLV